MPEYEPPRTTCPGFKNFLSRIELGAANGTCFGSNLVNCDGSPWRCSEPGTRRSFFNESFMYTNVSVEQTRRLFSQPTELPPEAYLP